MNPIMTIDKFGTEEWRKSWLNDNGEFHRTDGPAIEYSNGTKFWFLNGKCHRTSGAAIESSDGSKFWFIDGVHLIEQEWLSKVLFNVVKIELFS